MNGKNVTKIQDIGAKITLYTFLNPKVLFFLNISTIVNVILIQKFCN